MRVLLSGCPVACLGFVDFAFPGFCFDLGVYAVVLVTLSFCLFRLLVNWFALIVWLLLTVVCWLALGLRLLVFV